MNKTPCISQCNLDSGEIASRDTLPIVLSAIADMFFGGRERGDLGGKYFVLNSEMERSAASIQVRSQDEVWEKICVCQNINLREGKRCRESLIVPEI